MLGGAYADRGMPAFADALDADAARCIQAYVLELARTAAARAREASGAD